MSVSTQRIATWPSPSTSDDALYARTSALGATSIVEIDLGTPFLKVGLSRLKVKRVAGTAANFTLYLFSKSGVTTAGDISQEFAGAATAVGTLFDPDIDPYRIVMQADVNGKLYLMLGPDAGADNTFDVTLRFLVFQ